MRDGFLAPLETRYLREPARLHFMRGSES
jgi:hypothetical protein